MMQTAAPAGCLTHMQHIHMRCWRRTSTQLMPWAMTLRLERCTSDAVMLKAGSQK